MDRDLYRKAVCDVLFSDDSCADPDCENCQEMADRLTDLMVTLRPLRSV